jgi:hypothetical protein
MRGSRHRVSDAAADEITMFLIFVVMAIIVLGVLFKTY